MSHDPSAMRELMSTIRQQRDDLAVRIHLGSAEVKEEWKLLNDRLQELMDQYEPLRNATTESATGVWESLKLVGEEIRDGFSRVRKTL
ncbi:hypothetical protein Mal4_44050 [Maioricimonas rarisocia]|uniref:Uncharacterized protein n=1 Tax=Maioricimonas rarisocia TaxID=2528026 RepID=A0A517ZC75_9PLAN|nr:hypothetical protein [Maioricimonas rarisocia]QDU40051.1 hypothetical protein Mal4_44050 [Maioricimonas rarisocia]